MIIFSNLFFVFDFKIQVINVIFLQLSYRFSIGIQRGTIGVRISIIRWVTGWRVIGND